MRDKISSGEAVDFDPEALHKKYAAERERRLTHGDRKYVEVTGQFAHYLDNPCSEAAITRSPIAEEIDVLIVGGGMTGILIGSRLRKAGVDDIRIVEVGGDFGGTWYWNRYPGASCDIEALVYLPMLEEMGYVPTEKYARAPEIFDYLCLIGRRYRLYERTYFQTGATEFIWNEESKRWFVSTSRGDLLKARFICLATGNLARPKLPGIPGIATFQGHSFHTSRWDYKYTGGNSYGNLTELRDKRVAIIGTGASAVQVIPHLGEWSKHLYVFQRTPSVVDIRANRPIDTHWVKSLKPGWHRERLENFELVTQGMAHDADLVADSWTDIARRLSAARSEARLAGKNPAEIDAQVQLADFKKMEEIRRRIDGCVKDPATAEALKPYYNVNCKRPCFHDEYLPTFNRPNVTLVDTKGYGVDRITPEGLVVADKEYEVDCIVYSTGFQVLAMTYHVGQFAIYGVGGRSLEEKWGNGVRSLHGMFTHDFPNMMVVGHVRDGGGGFNGAYVFDGQSQHVVEIMQRCIAENIVRIEATEEAESGWAQTMRKKRPQVEAECTPGYLNNEGSGGGLRGVVYGGGSLEYIEILQNWRATRFAEDMRVDRAATSQPMGQEC